MTQNKWWESYSMEKNKEIEAREDAHTEVAPSPLISSSNDRITESLDEDHDITEDQYDTPEEKKYDEDKIEKLIAQVDPSTVVVSQKEKKWEAQKKVTASDKKSSAPMNLPVAESVSTREEQKKELKPQKSKAIAPPNLPISVPSEMSEDNADEDQKDLEPTEEELKDRLNKLLRGDTVN
jgi:hypothetical protein